MLNVTVITVRQVIFEGLLPSLVLPGTDGTFELLPYHCPFMSALAPGTIALPRRQLAIRGGVAQVSGTDVRVLVELAAP